ncbi:YdiL family protein [Actinobacillus equuli subsp. haemolyticus]|uniref:Aca2/YdiL-like domain-containing protein n=1 Tax=Actinobacillus equuli TaxID=718 RepID=UPI00241849B8|nr:DUF1870 family protein [Actinobacillus equuli]MDG4948823.1 YdiL family protein [Actinobacillus equuli subsp. haemolyticus]
MTGLELKLARHTLGLTIAEAAEHIGKVSKRSWEYWESGNFNIKEDVERVINQLLARRKEILESIIEQGQSAKKIAVIYYPTPEYCSDVIEWRFSQSLAATLSIDFGAQLVTFDIKSYNQFLVEHDLQDNQSSRSHWAAMQSTKVIN